MGEGSNARVAPGTGERSLFFSSVITARPAGKQCIVTRPARSYRAALCATNSAALSAHLIPLVFSCDSTLPFFSVLLRIFLSNFFIIFFYAKKRHSAAKIYARNSQVLLKLMGGGGKKECNNGFHIDGEANTDALSNPVYFCRASQWSWRINKWFHEKFVK